MEQTYNYNHMEQTYNYNDNNDSTQYIKPFDKYIDDIKNNSITKVEKNTHTISVTNCNKFIKLLKINKSIEIIRFPFKVSNTKCFITLNEMLKINTTLKEVDILLNIVDYECCKLLVDGMNENSSITILRLYESHFGSNELRLISDMIRINTILTRLSIYFVKNRIDNDAIIYMMDALRNNKTLQNIVIPVNLNSRSVCKSFAQYIKENNIITTIDMIGINAINPDCFNMVIDALDYNTSITGFFGVTYLMDKIQINRKYSYCARNKHNINLKSMLLQDIS
jgi:hypothetical protein